MKSQGLNTLEIWVCARSTVFAFCFSGRGAATIMLLIGFVPCFHFLSSAYDKRQLCHFPSLQANSVTPTRLDFVDLDLYSGVNTSLSFAGLMKERLDPRDDCEIFNLRHGQCGALSLSIWYRSLEFLSRFSTSIKNGIINSRDLRGSAVELKVLACAFSPFVLCLIDWLGKGRKWSCYFVERRRLPFTNFNLEKLIVFLPKLRILYKHLWDDG